MKKGEMEYAIRQASNVFDKWNDVADQIPKLSGYYYEMMGVVEDSVRIGARTALGLPVKFDEHGCLIDNDVK